MERLYEKPKFILMRLLHVEYSAMSRGIFSNVVIRSPLQFRQIKYKFFTYPRTWLQYTLTITAHSIYIALFTFKTVPPEMEARTHLQIEQVVMGYTKNFDLVRSHVEHVRKLSEN